MTTISAKSLRLDENEFLESAVLQEACICLLKSEDRATKEVTEWTVASVGRQSADLFTVEAPDGLPPGSSLWHSGENDSLSCNGSQRREIAGITQPLVPLPSSAVVSTTERRDRC